MRNSRLGFTLMEIMVVVVIIAVLASVAGPMIGDIVNQGKASATKSRMSSLKSAIITYKNDVGRYPFYGAKSDSSKNSAYDQSKVLNASSTANVLVNQEVLLGANDSLDENAEPFFSTFYGRGGRKWKGPYMDADPADFMVDSWGTEFKYIAFDHSLILWSAGPDGEFHSNVSSDNIPAPEVLSADSYADGLTDDLFISIARFRRKFN